MGNKTSWTRGDHETVRVKTLSSSHSHLQVVSKIQQFERLLLTSGSTTEVSSTGEVSKCTQRPPPGPLRGLPKQLKGGFRASRHRGRRRERRNEQTSDRTSSKRPKQPENGPNSPVCASEEHEKRQPGRRLQPRRAPKWCRTQSTCAGPSVRSKKNTENRPRVPRHVITTASTDAQIREWSAKPRLSRSNFSFQRAPCSPHKR